MAQSPPSCRRPYQRSRRHTRTYILTSSNSSPREYAPWDLFPPLHIVSKYSFYSGTPYLHRHPTTTPPSDPPRRVIRPAIFSRLSTAIFTFSWSRGALPPTSPLRQYQIRIPLLALPTLGFFPTLYTYFNILLKRWSLTSNVTPTPSSDPDSPSPYLPHDFSHLSTTILTFLEAVEPNLQRHPYTNIRFRFPNATFGSPSSRYPPCDFFPPLYLHFNFSWSGGAETSNVIPTPTSDSDFPPRVTHPRIFSHLSTSILTHHQAVEPSLQRHPYTLPYLHAPIR